MKWEYKVLIPNGEWNEVDVLNDAGRDGWMAWAMHRCPIDGQVVFHLKRPYKATGEPGQ